jgi:mannose-6-phosphate isomerase-like protein (cupin superfamily)
MTNTLNQPRYGLDPYKEWASREGIPIAYGIALDLFEVPLGDWPRVGARGAIAHFPGSGDFCNMFVLELAAGASTLPQQHLYEEIFLVLEGRGSTQIEFSDGRKRSFEWGPRSFFAIPLNARYRHFNGSGRERALLASTTNLPLIIKTFHNEEFVFNTPFMFADRFGKDEYYAGEGDLYLIRQGNNFWETNFVPDMADIQLTAYGDRGAGSSNIKFVLADGVMYAHMSEIAPATYKKGHRHMAGVHVMTLSGGGYSLLWYDGEPDFTRVDWKYGVVFPPLDMQFHQHFVTSNSPSRYVATGFGSFRYPVTEQNRRITVGDPGQKQQSSRSVKDGGNQIEYEDQDPRIHQIWLEEMRKNGVTPMFSAPGKLIT